MTTKEFLAQIKDPVHMAKAALTFAQVIAYPDLDIEHYLNQISELSKLAASIIPENLPRRRKAIALSKMLFGPGGLQGNTAQFYDPRNSFLNDVLDRKLGLPITLTAILIEVGARLGLDIKGIGLPGHFIAAIEDEEGMLYLDPFHNGRTITLEDCKKLVKQYGNLEMKFNPEWLHPVTQIEMLVRMLHNLQAIYVYEKEWKNGIQILNLLQAIQPDKPEHARDIGLIYFKSGNRRQAIYNLESYVIRKFRASDSSPIHALLNDLIRKEAIAN